MGRKLPLRTHFPCTGAAVGGVVHSPSYGARAASVPAGSVLPMTHTDPHPDPSDPSSPPGPPRRLLARSPEDLLAAVPVVLGFRATDSVVMLTFPTSHAARPDRARTQRGRARPTGPPEAFHARVDLPGDPDDLPDMVDALLDPVLRHRIDRVVLILYTVDAELGARTGEALDRAFTDAGVEVVDLMRADGRCWFALLPGRPPEAYAGTPYDDRSHPFVAQAVVDGRVTLESRAELAAGLLPDDPPTVEAVDRATRALDRAGPESDAAEAAWLDDALGRRLAGRPWTDEEVARLLVDVRDLRLRDRAWLRMSRDNASAHVEVWRDVVRRCPTHLLPAPACLLAFGAWLAGHGALAWCALDRCREADEDYRLAGLIATLLDNAVPPSSWDPPEDLPDLASSGSWTPQSGPGCRAQTARGTRH